MNLQSKNIDAARLAARRLAQVFEILACLDVSDPRYPAYMKEARDNKHTLDLATQNFITMPIN